ncbi:MAG: hypothetical protein ACRD15_11045, partial [Vicinamibacterales bacterium]
MLSVPRRRSRLRGASRRLLAVCAAIVVLGVTAQDAAAAIVEQVQSGTVVNNSNGVQTVTIASIDPATSFLIFQIRSNGDRPVNSVIRGRLASATTIEFERLSNEGAPVAINIQWYVATFGSGVKVQRGEVTMSASPTDVTIAAVGSISRAFVLWSKTALASDSEFGTDDPIVGDLTSTTNLQFRSDATSGHRVAWQVVEFTDAADINVQRGTVLNMTGATVSTTATLGTPVDVTKAFVLAAFRTAGGGPDIGNRMLRAELTDSTTVTFDRGLAGEDMTEIAWQVVELKDGSTVQRGTATFASGASQATAALGPRVNTTRALAFGSVQSGGGQNMGSSPYAVDDVIGVGTVTAALTPPQVTLQRSSTVDTASVGWFVVQFAGGSGFKVGSFTKSMFGPGSQVVPHGLGETPRALILWTQGRTDETFSSAPSSVAFRSSSSGSAPSGVLALTLPVPAGTLPNDVMIASIGFRPSGTTITPPAGWLLVRLINNPAGSANGLAVYGRAADYGEPVDYTWTFSSSTGVAGGIMSFSGVDITNPVNGENGQTTGNALTHTAPGVTTTVPNTMVVTTHAFSSSATWTPPSGMTEAFDVSSTAVPDCCGMSVEGNYVLQAGAGPTGNKTATASGDPD